VAPVVLNRIKIVAYTESFQPRSLCLLANHSAKFFSILLDGGLFLDAGAATRPTG
jgi:hypothetical protein